MGYYADRHGSKQVQQPVSSDSSPITSQGRSYYRERHKKEIPASENIFQRALGAVGRQAGQMMMPEIPKNPFDVMATRKSSPFTREVNAPGGMMDVIGGTSGEVVSDMANVKDPFTRGIIGAGLDPRSWLLGSKGAETAGRGIKTTTRSLINPSKVYGEALDTAKGKVNFLDVIAKHSDDPIVKKVLDKSEAMKKYGVSTLGEGGSVTEKLKNLTAKESQDFINDVKVGQTKAMLSGDLVKSNKVNLSKFFSDLSKAQNAGIEGIKGSKRLYGFSKNVGKVAKSTAGKIATGSILGASAKTAYDFLK